MLKNKTTFIAEVKIRSPFGYVAQKTWEELFNIANFYGDIISIHTDPRWGGSYEHIKKARSLTDKPILAKGIHASDDDILKAIQYGADHVLVVGRIPNVPDEILEKCFIEVNDIDQLKQLSDKHKAVWNTRDLKNGEPKVETFQDARKNFNGWLCQASFLKTVEDVEKGADAILVGTHLEEFVESLG